MENDPKKPRRSLWVVTGLSALAVLGLASVGSTDLTPTDANIRSYESVEVAPLPAVNAAAEASLEAEAPQQAAAESATLSNDNYYTNVDGNRVHAPAYADTSC